MAGEVTRQDESELIFKEFCCFQGGKGEHCFFLLLPYLSSTVAPSLSHPQTLTLPQLVQIKVLIFPAFST